MAVLGLFLLVPFLQVQDRDIQKLVQDFVGGEEKARKELVGLGLRAIRPLLEARDLKPDKIDPLLLELKKAAAYPRGSQLLKKLEDKIDVKIEAEPFGAAVFASFRSAGIPVFIGRIDAGELKAREVSLNLKGVPAREALDQICRLTGLDYAFFHNHVVLGTPGKLWPSASESRGSYGEPLWERQKRSADFDATLKQLRETKLDLSFQEAPLSDVVGWIEGLTGITFDIQERDLKKPVTIEAKGQPLSDLLALISQGMDLDFTIRKKGVVIDAPEVLKKTLEGAKR